MSPGTQAMMKMVNTSIKILAIITVTWLAVLWPTVSMSAENIRFRHVTSIYFDEQGVGLKQPEGVACNDKPLLIVADTGNGRLLRYIYQDRTLALKTVEFKLPQLVYPTRAKFNSRGEIYVFDRKLGRIIHLTPEGVFKNYINLPGSSSSETLGW